MPEQKKELKDCYIKEKSDMVEPCASCVFRMIPDTCELCPCAHCIHYWEE
jgi:hypothetical protein